MADGSEPILSVWPSMIAAVAVVVVLAAATTMFRSHPESAPADVFDFHGDGCEGPRVERSDVRSPVTSAPRGVSESWTRLVMLQQNHCALAQRLRAVAQAHIVFPGMDDAIDRPPTFVSSDRMGSCMLLGEDFLRARDEGEFGGAIDVLSADGGSAQIFDKNVRVLAATSAGVIGIGGYFGEAMLVAIDIVDGSPHAVARACLPAMLMDAAVDDDGTLLVARSDPWSEVRPNVAMIVAVDDDGALYELGCGMGRSGQRLDIVWETSLAQCWHTKW